MNFARRRKVIADLYFIGIVAGLLGLALLAMKAESADYNFYFNNTEQGDNSTNTPSFSTQGAKPLDPNEDPNSVNPEDSIQPAPGAPSGASPEGPQSTAALPAKSDQESKKYFRLSLSLLAPLFEAPTIGKSGGHLTHPSDYENLNEATFKPMLSFGVHPLKYLGFNIFASSYSGGAGAGTLGAELEVTPVHLGLFGFDRTLEIGLLGGAWNLSRIRYAEDHVWSERDRSKTASPFAGGRLAFNFGFENSKNVSWVVASEVRASRDHTLANLGLGMKF